MPTNRRCEVWHWTHEAEAKKVRDIQVHDRPTPIPPAPSTFNPTSAHRYRYRVGGRVGGWAVGRQHGEHGGNQLWHHTTAFAPNVHLPHPGGVSELMMGRPPRLLRAAVRLDLAVVLTSFPPREPTSGLADKGRLGSLGGWRTGLLAPVAAYPPLLHT